METDSDYSSDEEAIAEFLLWERRPYRVKPRADHFTILDENNFFVRFCLMKQTVINVLNFIEGNCNFNG